MKMYLILIQLSDKKWVVPKDLSCKIVNLDQIQGWRQGKGPTWQDCSSRGGTMQPQEVKYKTEQNNNNSNISPAN